MSTQWNESTKFIKSDLKIIKSDLKIDSEIVPEDAQSWVGKANCVVDEIGRIGPK